MLEPMLEPMLELILELILAGRIRDLSPVRTTLWAGAGAGAGAGAEISRAAVVRREREVAPVVNPGRPGELQAALAEPEHQAEAPVPRAWEAADRAREALGAPG